MIKYTVHSVNTDKKIEVEGLRLARETANFWASTKFRDKVNIEQSGVTVETYMYDRFGNRTQWRMAIDKRPRTD